MSSKSQRTYDEDSPRFTREMMKSAQRLHQLPPGLQKTLRGIQDASKKKKANKVAISIRLSQDVVNGLRASGAGWQGRVDEALRVWLERESKAGS